MKVLVTGANGFLGANLIHHLLDNGYKDIVAMVRKLSNTRRLDDIKDKIEFRYASLQDEKSLLEAFTGVNRIFHLAANVRIGSFRKKEIIQDNVQGSEKVFNIAKKLKIKDVIYISSISIFGSNIESVVCEDDVEKGKIMSTYGVSKVESYYRFKQAYNEGLNIKAVIPANIFGPDDPNFGPLFKNYVQKHLKLIAGNLNANMGMVYVDDVCKGIILVAEKGQPGHSYILNSVNITLHNLLKTAEKMTGIKAPRLKLPKTLIKGTALLSEIAGRIIRNNLLLNRQSANLLYTTHPFFDSTKARSELGWEPEGFKESFARTLSWYEKKYRKNKRSRKN
ncbi:MAG: NAD-dependent epimerase/dehydratase family protein [Acidobacteria bacterium]|nr:NAD-dependent epimerase/dehydratase family protein [Acidobacteriota bacterium]